jgi:hypothetical protein
MVLAYGIIKATICYINELCVAFFSNHGYFFYGYVYKSLFLPGKIYLN